MRRLAFLMLTLAGCQCFVPVEDDAGPYLVRDAGSDAGLPPECESAADCHGAFTSVRFCWPESVDAGFSCLDHHCIVQCGDQSGATCTVDPVVECLQCPPTAACIAPSCPSTSGAWNYHVEDLECRRPVTLSAWDTITQGPLEAGVCGVPLWLATDAGSVRLGVLTDHGRGVMTANVPLLGGWCRVSDLPTGAPRLQLDCPWCQVVLGP